MRAVVLCFLAFFLGACGRIGDGGQGGVVTLAPHLTETVFALGKGGEVVAVGRYDDYPPEAARLPKVGGYMDPDLERITALSPRLLILPGEHPQVRAFAERQHIPVLHVNMDSLATIQEGIATVGAALGCADAAAQLNARIDAEIAALRAQLAGVVPRKTLIVTSRESHDLNSIYTAGRSSFVSELVALAGGANIFADREQNYFEASKEDILQRAPEVILEFHCGQSLTQNQRQSFYDDWNAMSSLPAVNNGRIYFITMSHGLRPGPRIAEVARAIAAELHPEVLAAAIQ